MRRKKSYLIVGIVLISGLIWFGLNSTNKFKPVSTKAQTIEGNVFEVINQRARANNLAPSIEKSEDIAGLIVDNLSVLYIPENMQKPVLQQIASAHINGVGTIDENNIVFAVNELAANSGAPDYAYTNFEQVKVVRTFLHRLMPDLVSSGGTMTDLEALAVFTSTVTQKIDNDAFMVTASKFTGKLQLPDNQPFPGSAESESTVLSVNSEFEKHEEMLNVVSNYINSTNTITANQIITTLGIQ